ncbi:MAG: YDG domain-containing protein [Methylotenera sp.]|nr:YDG domain-containing protein [Methylotenera sp.]
MNRIYRLLWSRSRGAWVVASECAKRTGKSSTVGQAKTLAAIAASSLIGMSGMALADPAVNALPTGGQITAGSGAISSAGNAMTVQQNTQKMIANWQSFDIGANASVTFKQPNSSSIALNRIAGQNPSQIMGQLNANGRVMLVNPSGIVFGQGSQINVGGITATTLNISDADFLAGNYHFADSTNTAAIENLGHILANGGVVALVAPIVRNEGAIDTPNGSTALVAGNDVTLDFSGDGLVSVTVSQSQLNNLVENKGAIRADEGLVILTAGAASDVLSGIVNNSGIVEAKGLTQRGGRIVLGGGEVTNTGILNTSSSAHNGGDIAIDGRFVALGGEINTDGVSGGNITVTSHGDLSLADQVHAKGITGDGGTVSYSAAGRIIENNGSVTDASGQQNGGAITLEGGRVFSSGSYSATGATGHGGRIDMTAGQDINLLSAHLDASGKTEGGLIRVGGAFQGGKTVAQGGSAPNTPEHERFVDRWATLPGIRNAQKTMVNDSSTLNVSASNGDGGTAIVWSDIQTTMVGSINATGTSKGGAVEISSANELRHASLSNVSIGAGGQLLLDPKNITIGDAATATSWTYAAILGLGYTPGDGLAAGDQNGMSVALNELGDLLAIGSQYDDGAGNSQTDSGAVYLFSFGDGSFTGATLQSTIGNGYSGGKNVNLALDAGDGFGRGVSLNAAGDRLAVGARGDDGAANNLSDSGAVYLFSFSDGSFSGGVRTATIGNGYTGGNNINTSAGASSYFGYDVALNGVGDRLAVGAYGQDTKSGRVHLYTFNSSAGVTDFSGGVLAGSIGRGLTGGKNVTMTGILDDNDEFGQGVSLNAAGDRLAVGAHYDDVGGDVNNGAVYLFTFTDTSFTGGQLAAKIGKGFSGGKNIDLTGVVAAGDELGESVSLNAAGDRLAVSAHGDDGFSNGVNNSGAVYLFSFTDTSFTGGALEAILGNGYTGGKNVNVSTLEASDQFGYGLALNGVGNRLAVGAFSDDGFNNLAANSGAVYLFSFSDSDFSNGTLQATIGKGYSAGAKDYDLSAKGGASVTSLAANDAFGSTVSLNSAGDRMAVGTNAGYGEVYLFSFSGSSFAGGTLESIIGYNNTGGKNIAVSRLASDDNFGKGVSLNGVGDRLAVSAFLDDGSAESCTDCGAVYLFSFDSANGVTNFSNGQLAGIIGSGYTGGKNVDLSSVISTGEGFGAAVSLNAAGDRLAANVPNRNNNEGAVYLLSFTDTNFSGGALATTIGKNGGAYTYDINVPTLDQTDIFGYSISLNGVGDRLAVGSYKDDGFGVGNNGNDYGAAYLFSFDSTNGVTNFANGKLEATIGHGYTGGKNIDLSAKLDSTDLFGSGIALNDAGDQLAVGARQDDGGYANSATDSGAAYLFKFTDNTFSGGTHAATIGKNYNGSNDINLALDNGDRFGQSVSFNAAGDRLAVGAWGDDGYGVGVTPANNYGAVYLFSQATSFIGNQVGDAVYATLPDSSIALSPSDVAALLDAGVAVTLQASNDITLTSAIKTNNPNGNGGAFTLQAGRSLLLNGSITTDNGNLTLIANDKAANGVVNAYRDAGAAEITMGSGVVFNAGTGNVLIELRDGAGLTNSTSGNITLKDITANTITAINAGATAGSGIILNGALTATASSGDAIVLAGDDFTNNFGSSALTTSGTGRWLVWSTDFANDTRGSLVYDFKQYNATYGSSSVLGSGNGFLYTLAPTVTASLTGTVSKVYDGNTDATLVSGDYSVTGTVDGDSVNLAQTSASYDDKNVGTTKTVTASGLSIDSATNGGATVYGYQLTNTTANANVGAITVKTLTATYTGVNRIYDRTTDATVTSSDDRISGDILTIAETAAFTDKNVGTGKTVNVTGASLSGTDAGNYVLAAITGTTTADITVKTLTASYSGVNRIYDGTTDATVTSSDDRISGDILTIAETATFTDKNVSTGKTVNVAGASLSGTDAGNYVLAATTGTTTADITVKTLTASYTGVNRIYDGTTDATVTSSDDRISGDILTIAETAAFTDKNVDTGKTVNVTGASLSGTDAGNYVLAATTGTTTADITAKAITVSGMTADNKVYDGTTDATVVTTGVVFNGMITNDDLSVTATGMFDNKNVGTGKTVTLSSSYGGGDVANYSFTDQADTTASITPAALNIIANNDAKFVTQADNAGFAGVSYTGFVNGETDSVLAGTLSITRSNSGTDTAGIYNDVLVASGLSSSNYDITFAAGDYTIVPSDQLLVRVQNVSDTYGTATQYAISSVEYFDGSGIVRLDDSSVLGSSVSIDAGNALTINDGSAGTASFTLEPQSAATSTAGKLIVGAYQLGISGAVTENSANFSDTITVVGAHQVNQKSITATNTGTVSKVYDRTTDMTGVTLALSTLETNDVVSVDGIGAFDQKDVGTGLGYTISNLSLSGTDSENYYLSAGTSFSGSNGEITARVLALNFEGVNKIYDGNATVTVNVSDDRINGDQFTIQRNANFSDKNVGENKVVSISGVSLIGDDANNYTLDGIGSGTASADITRLDSVTWVGGTTGNWFDPANWAGGAVPDLANVANVLIPVGITVSFDTAGAVFPADASQVVHIAQLGSSGSLIQSDGSLDIGIGGMTLDSYTQSGGALTNAGPTTLSNLTQSGGSFTGEGDLTTESFTQTGGATAISEDFTATQSFSQTADGSLAVGGNTSITDTSGGMTIGNLNTSGTTTLTSTDGAISQVSGTTIVSGGDATITASDGGSPATYFDVTLDEEGNVFDGKVTVVGDNVTLSATGDLDADVTAEGNATVNAGGDLTADITAGGDATLTSGGDMVAVLDVVGDSTLTSGGDLTVSGNSNDLTTVSGGTTVFGDTTLTGNLNATSDGDITQTGPLDVMGTSNLVSTNGDITLDNPANAFGDNVTATGDNVTLAATGDLDADVTATGNATVNASGNLTADITAGGNATLTSGGDMVAVLDVVGDSTLTSGGDLTVSGNSNDLTTVSGGTTVFGDTTLTGNLNATSDGDITQTGPLDVAGTTDVTSTNGDIIFDDTSNTFGGTVTATGDNVTLSATGDLDADVTAEGNATVNASGNLTADITAGGDATLTSGGDMVAVLDVGGDTSFTHGGSLNVSDNSTGTGGDDSSATKNLPLIQEVRAVANGGPFGDFEGKNDLFDYAPVLETGADAATAYSTTVINIDGSTITASLSTDGMVSIATVTSDGRTTSRIDRLDIDTLPVHTLELSLSIAQLDVGSFLLLDEVRTHNPEIVAILSVFGQGNLPLPAGLSYDQATGQLSVKGWANWDPEQAPVYALAVDRMGNLLLLRVRKAQKISDAL